MHCVGWTIAALCIWNEYVLPLSELRWLPSITQHTWQTLMMAAMCSGVWTMLMWARGTFDGRHLMGNAVVAVTLLYGLAVLFGAPLVSLNAMAWAVYVGVSFCALESRNLRYIESARDALLDGDGRPTLTGWALLSTAVGCFVIPLDWDRPYQPFPIGSALVTSVVAPLGALISGAIAPAALDKMR